VGGMAIRSSSHPATVSSLLAAAKTIAAGVGVFSVGLAGWVVANPGAGRVGAQSAALGALAVAVLGSQSLRNTATRVRELLGATALAAVVLSVVVGEQVGGVELALALLAVAVLALRNERVVTRIGQPAVLGAVGLGAAGVFGGWGALGEEQFFGSDQMLSGAVVLLGASVALSRPRWGVMAAVTNASSAAAGSRRLLIGALAAPAVSVTVAGWVRVVDRDADLLPLLVALNVAVLGGFAAMVATRLAEAEARVERAERAVQTASELAGEAVPLTEALAGDLTPTVTSTKEWSVGWRFEPAVGNLSGDWFDVVEVSGAVHLVLVDVAGHGAGAALLASWCKHQILSALESGASPGESLAAVESLFVGAGQIATALVVRLGDEIRVASAGHPGMLLHSPDLVVSLGATAPPLGVGSAGFAEHRHRCPQGSVLVAVSDGIVESRNGDGAFWGEEALERTVRELAAQPAEVLAEAVFDRARSFGAGFRDDATVVVLVRQRR
jgi:serine phosphatase RsbU (regulator of sigma subunit)